MKKFEDLTRLGRIRRCRKIIEEGMVHYDIDVEKMTFLEEATNVFYKIVDKSGKKYAVKIYQEISSDLDDALVEMYFLKRVSSQTDIVVPTPIRNKNKEYVTLLETKYDAVKKRMAVYEWMESVDFDERETVDHFVEIGKMTAKLHELMKDHKYPTDLSPKKIDKVLYYAGDDYFYKMDKYKDRVKPKTKKLLDFAIPYFTERMKKLYVDEPFMIHGDLNPWNIRLHKNEVRLLDFEDTSLGYELHDIAILLFYFQLDERYESFKEALFKGYRSIRPLEVNEDDMEMLMAARRVNFMNYFLVISNDAEKYLETNTERVMNYLKKTLGDDFNLD